MQNRKSSLASLALLLVSSYAYTLSSDAYADAEEYALQFEFSVGLSPSPVRPQFREGQALLTVRETGEGEKQVSQGGKQESLSKSSSFDEDLTEYNEAVAEPVQ